MRDAPYFKGLFREEDFITNDYERISFCPLPFSSVSSIAEGIRLAYFFRFKFQDVLGFLRCLRKKRDFLDLNILSICMIHHVQDLKSKAFCDTTGFEGLSFGTPGSIYFFREYDIQ